jgi:hypothetical protein
MFVVHKTHIKFDVDKGLQVLSFFFEKSLNLTNIFMLLQGLPKEWAQLLQIHNISEKELRSNPNEINEILTFAEENMPDVLMPSSSSSPCSSPPPRPVRALPTPMSPVASGKSSLNISSSSSSSPSSPVIAPSDFVSTSSSSSVSTFGNISSQKKTFESPPLSPPTRPLDSSLKSEIPLGLPTGRPPKKVNRSAALSHSGSQGNTLQKAANMIERENEKKCESEGKLENEKGDGSAASLSRTFGLESQNQGPIPDCKNIACRTKFKLILFWVAISSIKSFVRTEDPSQLVDNLEKIGAG